MLTFVLPGMCSGEEVGFQVVVGIGLVSHTVDKVNRNCGAFFLFCTFGRRCLKRSFVDQGGAIDSAHIFNIGIEVRRTHNCLLDAVNTFQPDNP